MRIRKTSSIGLTSALLVWALNVFSSDFQNLGFESANLPVLPLGQSGGFVSVADALPGWNAFIGTQLQGQVGHNQVAFGSSALSVMGPNQVTPPFEGNFDLLLMAGVDSNSGLPADVSISQTGQIPLGSMSIQFATSPNSQYPDARGIRLELGGQNIPLQVLSTSSGYLIVGGDVSQFAGQTTELEITAPANLAQGYNVFGIDDITFSTVPVPEPSTWALFGLGALLLANRVRKRGR